MTKQVRWALGLWMVLAAVVFNVVFDWHTRIAGLEFAWAQAGRHANGQPLPTLNEAFTPMVHAAAVRSSAWFGLILATGVIAIAAASRTKK
jgi:hypothetical protein